MIFCIIAYTSSLQMDLPCMAIKLCDIGRKVPWELFRDSLNR
jgi:hypothetical protein